MAGIRSNISKGRQFQTKTCDALKEAFDLDTDDIRPVIGGENGSDIVLMSDRARERVGLEIECKNQKNISIWASLEQAKAKGGVPALVFHRSKQGVKDVWICIPFEHFLEIKRKALERDEKI